MLEIKDSRINYVAGFTDMRCGKDSLSRIVRNNLNRDPSSGEVFVFMSKSRRRMKALRSIGQLWCIYDLSFSGGMRFMKVAGPVDSGVTVIDWKYLLVLLQCPARDTVRVY